MKNGGMLAAVAAAAGMASSEDITVDANLIKVHFPEVAAALIGEGKAEGRTEGKSEGQKAEHDRLAAIDKLAMPGNEAIIAAHKADMTKTAADAAIAIVEADKEARSKQLGALKTDDKQVQIRSEPANPGSAASKPSTAGLTGEAKYKAEWAGNPDLAKEFSSEAAYIAFRSMDDAGRIKIKGRAA